MSSRIVSNPRHVVATCIGVALALCLLAAQASAQTIQPQDEVFGGYSWLHSNGYGDLGYKVPDITHGFDLSNTYYLPQAHNLGLLADGSGHFGSGSSQGNGVGFGLFGVQFKYHTDTFSPFARAFVGFAYISPKCCGGTKTHVALGGGGGFDLNVNHMWAIRLAQVDYIYSNYSQRFLSGHTTQWNSIRLAAGVILNLGSYYNPPLTCTASATPTEVFAPDPVKVTTTGAGFNPKHKITYGWAANGGRVSDASSQTATVDTTGVAAGSYSANSTITDIDPKFKNLDSGHHSFAGRPDPIPPATCAAPFTIKQPLPPNVSCSASPTTIAVGEPATITMTATDPQGW